MRSWQLEFYCLRRELDKRTNRVRQRWGMVVDQHFNDDAPVRRGQFHEPDARPYLNSDIAHNRQREQNGPEANVLAGHTAGTPRQRVKDPGCTTSMWSSAYEGSRSGLATWVR
ncbi:hypothetical protein MRB53_041891 [Persea americana]|nr:hypothetical protein MRB53_041891 [Persea americana]